MSRIELTEQFYEDEVREGFYIPACVKQAWGAQVQVLNDVDRVCEELGIRYFAAWGTFLGALRHGGFVPWDDDFDICMLRDDYNRFLEEGVALLPDGYEVYNLKNREEHTQFTANIVAKGRICFEQEHLDKYHGFPYVVGMDVFILDYMSDKKDSQEMMKKKAKYVLKLSDEIQGGTLKGVKLKEQLEVLKEQLGITIPTGLDEQEIRRRLDIKAEELFASFAGGKDKAKNLVQMMPWGLNDEKIVPKFYYDDKAELKFETGTIPVPLIYDDALRICYGDYMMLYKNAGGHDYPFFAKSRSQLQEVLDFELPEYRVDAKELLEAADRRKKKVDERKRSGETYRDTVNECLDEMIRLSKGLNGDDVVGICVDMQQLAIDLGTYMEAVKGEGYDIVAHLEKLCELLYAFTQGTVGNKEVKALFDDICCMINRRREVLFLPFKAAYWDKLDGACREAFDDPDTDVYVVPIPYYYKDYMGRLKDMQFDTEGYPEDIVLTHYDSYDYAVHHPDRIVIQNPYDDQNIETSVPPFFYSDRLLEFTDSLVYIPWFETYDFTRENEREYINMSYYCTVPGVINADTVVLGSQTLKDTYIDKLCDFAGEKTRQLWEDKIVVRESMIKNLVHTDNETDPAAKTKVKTMLYYPDFSNILLYKEKAIDKIKSVLDTFNENKDKMRFVILRSRLIDDELKKYDADL
ncbi:MAG: LicD family protein, partial [Lachnospiraceae bacterium]|nr:LicD family protein [Lachnospiraceae bacterium]